MDVRPCWFVQSTEDGSFLAPDGEGGVVLVSLLAKAVPFELQEAAAIAAVDHLDGRASIVRLYQSTTCLDFNQ